MKKKTFDCVEMKRRAQEALNAKLAELSESGRKEFLARALADLKAKQRNLQERKRPTMTPDHQTQTIDGRKKAEAFEASANKFAKEAPPLSREAISRSAIYEQDVADSNILLRAADGLATSVPGQR